VAVQEELAHVICALPGIERAAVLYAADGRPAGGLAAAPRPTASVNVRTQAGQELEPVRVQAIRVLVAASIAGLEPERVAVTDLRSGRVFVGPLAVDPAGDDVAQADPALARRIVHERHLAGKLRQGLAFVEGAIVDVTVTFQPPAPPQLPAPGPPPAVQRIADANAPATVGEPADDEHAVVELPTEQATESAEGFPATILVSLAVPESFFVAARALAASHSDATAADLATEERLRDHVLGLLPPTTRADGRQVLLTRFPVGSTPAAVGPTRAGGSRATAAAAVPAEDAPGGGEAISLEAAWRAVLAGHPEDVPREVWLGVIAVAAGLLGWLVLRPTATATRRPPHRRPGQHIDWSAVEDGTAEVSAPPASRRQVAA
jgi:hypothetical protein